MKTCCFIGHREIEDTPLFRRRLSKTLIALIEMGVTEFIFGDHSRFNDICYEAVTELKKSHPEIRRIKYRKDYPGELDDYARRFFLAGFEESICPANAAKAGRVSYIKRNRAMIEASDICVFYRKENYLPGQRKNGQPQFTGHLPKSGTELAFKFALQKKKEIINLYQPQN